MLGSLDLSFALLLIGWTVALIAGIRKHAPKVDGPWVLVVAPLAAALVAAVFYLPSLVPAPYADPARYALLALIGAVGGVAFVQQLIDRIGGKSDSGALSLVEAILGAKKVEDKATTKPEA